MASLNFCRLLWLIRLGITVTAVLCSPLRSLAEVPGIVRNHAWALEVTSPSGQHNLLMGTLHVPDKHLHQPDPRILQSYRVVVYEHFAVDGGSMPTVRWREALTSDDLATLRLQIRCSAPSLAESDIDNLLARVLGETTPLEANQFAYQRCASADYAPRDLIVQQAQMRYGLPASYLESPKQAGDAPRALALTIGAAVSGESIHFALSGAALNAQADLVDALNAGDYEAAAKAVDRSLEGAGMSPASFYNIMVRRRNRNWMKTLPPLLDRGDAFVLVGAEHLPGRDGLIALLRDRGYSVRPVMVPAGSGTVAEAFGQEH